MTEHERLCLFLFGIFIMKHFHFLLKLILSDTQNIKIVHINEAAYNVFISISFVTKIHKNQWHHINHLFTLL
jgi:hypothetical protein